MAITTADKYREVRRELAYRRNVFRNRVGDGKMSRTQAARRIEIMTAIVRDYERLLEQEANREANRGSGGGK